MDRTEAFERLEYLEVISRPTGKCTIGGEDLEALRMAIAALREQEELARNSHDVARGACKQTNADRIRAMTDEELAHWFANMWDCHYCSEHERLDGHPLLRAEQCDQKCEQHCLEWLKQPCGGADHA